MFWKICLVFFISFGASSGVFSPQQSTANPAPQDFLKQFLPLSEDTPREIQNPYHAKSEWKLWAKDPSPMIIKKPHFEGRFEVVNEKYHEVIPTFEDIPGSPMVLQDNGALFSGFFDYGAAAGFFDDVYMSLDNGHTGLGGPLKNLFLHAGKMSTAGDHQTRFQLGVNFTSQSYANRGRAIVDDLINNLDTEKNFFFANCIRATPAHNSLKDIQEDSVTDLYDGLHSSSYHSIGQSGSEGHALSKMMIAGASMPRATKDLLKEHGAYAIALLTLFKMALPYADANGLPLPFENELRHRPAYSSNGDPEHKHFCSANVHYHGYDEDRHLWEMARLARGMNIAPPVALLSIAGIRIESPSGPITERSVIRKRMKSSGLTSVRLWGEPGESIDVLVDLRKSYDLQGQDLSYACQPLYPNQGNIQIQNVSTGVFSVKVEHDMQLPKGRIPVICTVRNQGDIPSNPVFLNFYWPGEKELFDYGLPDNQIKKMGLEKLPVTVNKRPVVKMSILGDSIACNPGDTVSIKLDGTDPEGYPVTIYRRLGQWGTLRDGHFQVKIPDDAQTHIEPVHFIFSDGNGGYTGKQIKLCIGKAEDKIEKPWATSLLGKMSLDSRVSQEGENFTFKESVSNIKSKEPQGLFAFQMVSGDVDLIAQIPVTTPYPDIGLLMTNSLDHFSRRAYIGFFHGAFQGEIRPREQRWGRVQVALDESYGIQPELVRIVKRKGLTGVFASQDGNLWVQLAKTKVQWYETTYVGILSGRNEVPTICRWKKTSEPVAFIDTKRAEKDKAGNYMVPLKIGVNLPPGYTAHYTTDGSEPSLESPRANKPIEMKSPGIFQMRVTAYKNDHPVGTTIAFYSLIIPVKKMK